MTAPLVAALLVMATLAAGRAAVLAQRSAGAGFRVATLSPRGRPALVLRAPPFLPPRLVEAGLDVDGDRVWSGWLITSSTLVTAGLVAGGPGLAAVATCVAAAGPLVAWRLWHDRGSARLEAALPGAVDAMARGLRSGASLRQAVAEAATSTPGELGRDLARLATATDQGAALVDSLEEWGRRRPVTGVRLVVSALCLASEMGGATAQAVDGVAETLRQRLSARAEARSLATQARVSAAVIAVAPVAFCAVASATDPRTLHFLFGTAPGLAFLSAGLVLDVVGALWMARITRIEP